MRLTASLVVATLLALSVGVCAGQAVHTDLSTMTPNSRPVTLHLQNVEFADVVSFLGQISGIQIRVAPGVSWPSETVSLDFTDAKFADVFKFLVKAANLGYTVVDAKTVLITKKS